MNSNLHDSRNNPDIKVVEEGKRILHGDIELEIDEMYISSGQKGEKNLDRPPRKRGLRAN
ncbi:hypothetical protein MSIBF_A1140007 [groundwater metagenome]|uniref:Uncharacterized protein n=1 Tax=groundwater metagenome TaxID=717931 RepID=A0A098E814_9ZZZZ